MTRIFLILAITSIFTSAALAQSVNPPKSIKDVPISKQKIIFYKINNLKKIVRLKQGRQITIYYYDSLRPAFESIIDAKLYSENDSVLYVYAAHGSTRIVKKGTSDNIKIGEEHNFWYPPDSIIGINFKHISYILRDNPDVYVYTAAIMMVASAASAFVIAPAASINYSKRTFDSERYFDIMYPSLGVLVADIAVANIFSHGTLLFVKP